jgi:hypothetical protein
MQHTSRKSFGDSCLVSSGSSPSRGAVSLLTEGFIAVFQNVAPLGVGGFLVFNFLLTCRPSGALWIIGIQFSIDLPPRRGLVWWSLKERHATL